MLTGLASLRSSKLTVLTALEARLAQAPPVEVAQPVVRRMREMPRREASATAKAMRHLGDRNALRIQLPPLRDQPGHQYWVTVPDNPSAAALVYRLDGDTVLVVALMPRDEYEALRQGLDVGPLVEPAGQGGEGGGVASPQRS
jgi:hypothetical protein